MIIYIIRHGDPDYKTDTLTERGKIQAELVGKRLHEVGIDRVFSSPLGRAKETAAPLCRMAGLECHIEEWAREIDTEKTLTPVPDGQPKSISNLQNTYFRDGASFDLNCPDSFNATGVNDTQMREECERIDRCGDEFLARLGYVREGNNYRVVRANDDRVALFCHGAMGRAWIASLLHIPLHIMWASFKYTHTGVTAIEFKNNADGLTAPKCFYYSDMSHIYASGAENMKYNNTVLV